MTARARISRLVSPLYTSPTRRRLKRKAAALRRILSGAPARLHYFHQVDDPYGHLAVQCLPRLAARYRVAITPHLVPPPDDAAAPERVRLKAYALRDAARLARRYGLSFPAEAREPAPEAVRQAQAALARALGDDRFAPAAQGVGTAIWSGGAIEGAQDANAEAALADGEALRRKLGHYLGAMFQFEGEWYWGVDRLHHLEARLREQGLDRAPSAPPIAPFQEMSLDGARAAKPLTIEFWFSFRSPYSWIAAPRLHRLARHYGAQVDWRFILPMVMRGLPVPPMKSRYIVLDVKREAELLGLPFGTMVDPVGRGAERALAVLHRAVQKGRGAQFAESGLKAAFADGIDLASDNGLRRAALRAGLAETDVAAALADPSWRDAAEANRKALFDAGLWGAPSYRVNGLPAHWGQDRLWTLEEDLKAVIAAQ